MDVDRRTLLSNIDLSLSRLNAKQLTIILQITILGLLTWGLDYGEAFLRIPSSNG